MKPGNRLKTGARVAALTHGSRARTAVLSLLLVAGLMTATSASFASETYQHDALGRLTDVAYDNGGSIHYGYDANGNILSVVITLAATAADGANSRFDFALGPARPNPGTGPTAILFSTPVRAHVTLRAFNVSGREVATLVDGELDPGRHTLRFDTGRWAEGVYYYRLAMPGHAKSGRMVVVR
jgi:YD repeat-containing protein